jgi:chloramphenicol-sensitive protein RarD
MHLFRGIVLSLASSCLFASLYYYPTLLAPLGGMEIFGWRMVLTLPCVTLFMLISKEWSQVVQLARRLKQNPGLMIGLLCSSTLLATQQWLFMWAPLNGRGLEVSLGYFLLPLTMLLVGRWLYHERLSLLQKAAGWSACIGVVHELYRVGGLSWATLLAALGFPAYFVLRRWLNTSHLGGLWFDMLLTLPFTLWVISGAQTRNQLTQHPRLYLLLIGLAMISALAFMFYISASRLLPLSLFGLLEYVEPVLMLQVALILGEKISTSAWLTYIPIWLAVMILILDGIRHVLRNRQRLQQCSATTSAPH